MLCLGLDDVGCGWLIQAARRISAALNLVSRYGFTGGAIAAGLMLFYWVGRRLAEGIGIDPM